MQYPQIFELLTIFFYLLLMIAVGILFNRFNRNTDDYFRNGCKGTWWLVGMSTFMITFTAWTFTGAAGAAFLSGWTVFFIYFGNAVGLLLCGLFIAPWFRQLRIVTVPEVYYLRYGELTRQFIAYLSFTSAPIFAGLTLYGLAIFISAIFNLNIQTIIILLGAAVVIYSMTGGSWAVMATDFLQGAILIPLTLLVGFLSLYAVGGVEGLFTKISEQGLEDEFRFLKPDVSMWAPYSIFWGFTICIHNALGMLNFNGAARFAAVKTGRDASKACYLAAALMLVGAVVWLLPPIVGRLLYADEILSTAITQPAESSYAIVALNLLPSGLTGLIAVAIFSATMSNMDTGLNRNSAIVVKDMYPVFCRWLGWEPSQDQAKLVLASRFVTLLLGVLIILLAVYFSMFSPHGIFNTMLNLMIVLNAPLAPPALFGLFMRKVPRYSAMAAIAAGWIPAVLGVFSGTLFGEPWGYQVRFISVFSVSSIVFIGSSIFWKYASNEYRDQVIRFFTRRDTPIRFEEEVGAKTDFSQLRILGIFVLIISFGVFGLAFVPENINGGIITGSLAATLFLIGALMTCLGYRGTDE